MSSNAQRRFPQDSGRAPSPKKIKISRRRSPAQPGDAFEHCAYGIAVVDPATNCIAFCNRAFARALGRAKDEVVGLPISEMFSPEERSRVAGYIAESDRNGTAEYDVRVMRKDGSLYPVAVALVSARDEHGAVAYRVASTRDISKRLHAIKAGHESQERFRLLFEHSLDAVLETEPDGSVLAANPAACAMFGRTEDEIRRCGRTGLVDLTDPRLPTLIDERKRTGKARGELRFVRKDGTRFEAEISTAIFTNPHGRPRSSMIIRDLTEQLQSADLERLQRALAVRLATTADLGEGLEACLDAALQATGMDAGGVYLVDEKTSALDLVLHRGLSPDFVQGAARYPADSDHTRLIMAGRSLHVRFAELNLPLPEAEQREGLRCVSVVPFRDRERIIGCLNVASHSLEEIPSSARLALETIAANAAQAVTRLRTEAALRASAEKFRGFFELAADPVCIASLTGWFLEINAAFVRILGYSREELLSRSFLDFVHPEDQTRTRAVISDQLQRGQTVLQFTNRYLRKDGQIVWLEWVAQPVNEKGIIISLARDVTARRQAETELEQTRNTLLEAQRIAHLGSFEYIAATQTTVWSEEEFRIYGLDPTGPSPAYDVMLARCIHPDDAALLHTTFTEAMRSNSIYELEHRIVRPDGSVRWVYDRAQPHFDENGKLLRYVGATLDITERKQAEAALREGEARFRGVVESAPDVIFIQTKGRFAYMNEAAVRLFGATGAAALVGESVLDRFAPENRAQVADRIRRLNEARQNVPLIEEDILRLDGSRVAVEVSAAPFRYEEESGALVFARDITARRQAEAAVRMSEERLRLALAAANQGIYDLDVQTGETVVSSEYASMLGYDPATFRETNAAWIDRLHPDDRAVVAAAYRDYIAGRLPEYRVEFRQRMQSGAWKWILSMGRIVERTSAGEPLRMLGTHTDITARKQAEEALQRSEEKFAIAFANNPAAIALTRLEDGRFVDVNRSWEAMLGYRRHEIIGRSAREMHIWPSPDSAARFVAALQDKGELHDWEQSFLRRSGEVFISQLSAQVLTVQGERLVLSTLLDITGRKHAEAALRESEANLLEAQRIAQIGSWTFDIGSGRVTWSDELLRIFDLERDAFGGTHAAFVERIHPDDRPAVLRTNEIARTTGQSFDIEYRIVLTQGEIRYIREQGSATRGAEGSIVRLFGTAQDITARRQAERLLRLRGAALEAAANAIVITDRNGMIEWANPAFTALSGWTLNEAVGKNPRDLIKSGEHDVAFYRRMWSTILTGNVWRGEIVNRRKDGAMRTEEITITPLRSEGGEIGHFIAIKQDITDQKAMEGHFLQAQRMEAIGNLAGGIAHDLNNILAPITLVSGLLNDRLSGDSDRELLAMVQAGARRGAEIVKQLLTFSRGQAGERIAVQPRHLIKEVMAMMRETFPREIDLRQQFPTDLWTVNADPTQLHQVLLNLCVNSRDAMPNGGSLTIAASNRTLAADNAALAPGSPLGPYVVIEVIDTGHGIPLEIRQRVFEPFFTTKPIGKGTGLGLSTVIGIVRSHGGFVTVDSALGKGSTFRVFLPAITDGSELPAETPVAPAGLPATATTVLVVEDERDVREATSRVLKQGGYRVFTAVNGTDALTQYFQHRSEIRLIVTDLMMPVMNGMELIRALRATDSKVKIIAMTGLADAALTPELANLGVIEVVPKPFSGEVLLNALLRRLTDD